MTTTPEPEGRVAVTQADERLAEAAKAWEAFKSARERMNAARPDAVFATPCERALYDEYYRSDHAAEREHWRTAIRLAQVAGDILAQSARDADEIARLREALSNALAVGLPDVVAIAARAALNVEPPAAGGEG